MNSNDKKMQIVEITIRNNLYKLVCKGNEVDHLKRLSQKFNNTLDSLVDGNQNKYSDSLLFLIASLTILDKVEELTNELKQAHETINNYQNILEQKANESEIVNEILLYCTARIKKLMQHLEKIS